MELTLFVNGVEEHDLVSEHCLLIDLLRREGYYSVKQGCETGDCGVCTVLLDDRPVVSCLILAPQVDGKRVTTIEGLTSSPATRRLQAAFVESGAIQCGYCTPAMVLVANALLDREAAPSEEQIRDALAGILCRCTGYVKPVEAVRRACQENGDDNSND